MTQHQEREKADRDPAPSLASGNEVNANAPGQKTSGTDRAEVESEQAHQSHHAGGSGQPGTGANVPRSEEAKNQEATSQQSRALSGTTAPRKV